MTEDRRYDVAVVGAGVVGTAIGRQLARYRLRTVLLERRRRRRHRDLEGQHRHRAHRASTPSRAASSPSWSGAGTSCSPPTPTRPASRSSGREPSWWPGTRSRRPGSTTCWPRPGPTGTSVPARITLDELAPARTAPRRQGRRAPSPSPTSRSSARGARASPSPPKRSGPASSSASARRSPTSRRGRQTRLAARTPRRDRSGPAGWSTRPASASDLLNRRFGHDEFTIAPRRGQLIVFDKLARRWCRRSCCRCRPNGRRASWWRRPSTATCCLGPTAEDIADRRYTATTAEPASTRCSTPVGASCPTLVEEEVTATYAGVRAATEHRDYQITIHDRERYACVGGIRSTGLTASLAIAEYVVEQMGAAGLRSSEAEQRTGHPRHAPARRARRCGPSRTTGLVQADPAYGAHRVLLRAGHRGRGAGRARRARCPPSTSAACAAAPGPPTDAVRASSAAPPWRPGCRRT